MKKYLYLLGSIVFFAIIVLGVCFTLNEITVSSIISIILIILIFGSLGYICFGVFFAGRFGKRIKGTKLKEYETEYKNEDYTYTKYTTEYAFLNNENKLIYGHTSLKFDTSFVPIKIWKNFKYVDYPQNAYLYKDLDTQHFNKKGAVNKEYVQNIIKVKKSKRGFIIFLILMFVLLLVTYLI